MKKKAIMNWSGGKDSSLALYYIKQKNEYTIPYLLTTFSQKYNRVSMHGVRKNLLERQARELGIPLVSVSLPTSSDLKDYEASLTKAYKKLCLEGISHTVFGDIFLDDLRTYREHFFENLGIKSIFPIWKKKTEKLIRDFIQLGFRAIVVAANARLLDKSFVGREVNHKFIEALPSSVDPCGEYGEFHTFVYDAPIFKNPIPIHIGEKVLRSHPTSGKKQKWDTAFWYCDLTLDKQ